MGFAEQKQLDELYVMPTFARKQVCFVEGEGMRLRDDAGKEYLDFLSGIGVCSLGHCHPAVVDAIAKQAARLIHVSNYFYIEQRGEVAKLLSDALNGWRPEDAVGTWKTFFANSGAEANECAMKLARVWSRRNSHGGNIIVTLEGSFHGRTMETLAATAQPAKQELFEPLPGGFVHVPINDLEALQAVFDAHPQQICAVMLEVIQGESGVHPCTQEFLRAAEQLAHSNGALLIADEVQTGIYRTGKAFAFQHFGIQPDIVAIAKGVAAGVPMGACAAREDIAAAFQPGDHGSTFGGSNLAMAAAHTTLHVLHDEHFTTRVTEVGAYLAEALAGLAQVIEVRGLGLMLGAELDEALAPDVVAAGLEAGLVLNAPTPTTLRFLPPLVCEKADVDVLIEKLSTILSELGNKE
ncbi:MAG: aspartate aminotransferase family protein [Eggerthellaceae bacterium]|nr:aspartate aminotransferase family protein [Eggerthellaceae bacterium]